MQSFTVISSDRWGYSVEFVELFIRRLLAVSMKMGFDTLYTCEHKGYFVPLLCFAASRRLEQ